MRSYQKSFIVSACARMSRPAPKSANEMATVTTTATVMVRLRRRPVPISLARYCTCMRYLA